MSDEREPTDREVAAVESFFRSYRAPSQVVPGLDLPVCTVTTPHGNHTTPMPNGGSLVCMGIEPDPPPTGLSAAQVCRMVGGLVATIDADRGASLADVMDTAQEWATFFESGIAVVDEDDDPLLDEAYSEPREVPEFMRPLQEWAQGLSGRLQRKSAPGTGDATEATG